MHRGMLSPDLEYRIESSRKDEERMWQLQFDRLSAHAAAATVCPNKTNLKSRNALLGHRCRILVRAKQRRQVSNTFSHAGLLKIRNNYARPWKQLTLILRDSCIAREHPIASISSERARRIFRRFDLILETTNSIGHVFLADFNDPSVYSRRRIAWNRSRSYISTDTPPKKQKLRLYSLQFVL